MRITSINLKNIGVFTDTRIDFQPCPVEGKAEIHIFTGTNGSGKSTVLKALAAAFEQVATIPDNSLVCPTDTNNLTKYMRTKGESSSATVCIEEKEKPYCITYHNCPHGQPHIHLTSNEPESIKIGRLALAMNYSITGKVFTSSLFAYSGYRSINFSNNRVGMIQNSRNPLYQSLEFIKEPNAAYTIENWIKASLLKRAYAEREELVQKQTNYNDIIKKLEYAISELMGKSVQFRLDASIRNPIIVYDNREHNFEVLPDGLKSFVSWLADLCMRLDDMDWVDDIPIFERNIILFLDEIEVHLHPEWQRKILFVVQKLFPNAQIFISTHSPFVVNSVDGAWVYSLEVSNGEAKVRKTTLSQDGHSITNVLHDIFGVTEMFGLQVAEELQAFYALRDKAQTDNLSQAEEKKLRGLAKKLAKEGTELQIIIQFELKQISRQTQKNYAL
ncbi:MAG: AAA family ATPase [Chitinophagales bacterium]|nr:AAA family ATPase [Chitinophagales bacterium]